MSPIEQFNQLSNDVNRLRKARADAKDLVELTDLNNAALVTIAQQLLWIQQRMAEYMEIGEGTAD